MAWFESGRNGSVEYRFTLTARNRGAQGGFEGASYAAGPDFTVRLAAVRETQPGGTSYFLLTIDASGGFMDRFYSTPVGGPPGSFDHTATVEVVVTYPVRERKEVRVPSGQGLFDWLPPDVELEYALHPRPGTNFTIVTTCTDPALQQTVSRPASVINATASLAQHLQIGIGITEEGQNSGASGFIGLCAEVTAVSCTQWGLNFRDSGTPSSGFDLSTANARCFTTANSIRLELTNATGIEKGSGSDDVWPNLSWGYDGWVRVFADPYPGNPVLRDYPTDADYTATGGHLVQNFLLRRRFNWTTTLKDVGRTLQTQNPSFNQHPAYIKAELQEAWVNSAGETYDDRRIPLEDDAGWDAIQLSRQASLVVEPLNSLTGWDYTVGSGVLSVDAGALKVTPADEDCEISKTVNHDLGTYRYLKIDLKADLAETPVRIKLGAYYWDVLVEANATFETKTFDLAAPHNAASFDDVTALQAINAVGFGDLQLGTIYWFKNMRLERAVADHLHVLPPFRKDEILFHRADRRPGLVEHFRIGSLLRGIQDVVGSINARLDSGFGATAVPSSHAYYNPVAPSGFLEDLMEVTLGAALTLRARVRADRIIPWAGMGDPAQPMPNSATLAVRFTKRLRGLLDGLVFIRDVPGSSLSTRVQIRRNQDVLQTLTTESTSRAYRVASPYLQGGTYEVRRVDQSLVAWMAASRPVVNREFAHQHLRAQVIDFTTRQPLAGIDANAEFWVVHPAGDTVEAWLRVLFSPSNAAGMYTVPYLQTTDHGVTALSASTSEDRYPLVSIPERALYDVAFAIRQGSSVSGSTSGVSGAAAFAGQSESAYTDFEQATGAGEPFIVGGLNVRSDRAPDRSFYEVWIAKQGYSTKLVSNVEVVAGQNSNVGPISLVGTGSLSGLVTQGGSPAVGAIVYANQDDGLLLGWGLAETGADGRYTISGLEAPGNYTVKAQTASTESSSTAAVNPNATTTVDFVL